MIIYFSGIGGVGIGPLAEIAYDAGYTVVGSDLMAGPMTEQLSSRGITVYIGQNGADIAAFHEKTPIDWLVYSASIPGDNPERQFAREHGIRESKRDELLAYIIHEHNLQMIAVAGTHGKTSTTSMLIWCFKELGLPLSYSVGTTLTFGPSGIYDKESTYFVYECDEYDRNFLHFEPALSVIPALDYDHPDTYKNEHMYKNAFLQFIGQSGYTLLWEKDRQYLEAPDIDASYEAYDELMDLSRFHLAGDHVRHNAFLVLRAMLRLFPDIPEEKIVDALNRYPGSGRRFEKLAENLYSDYGHHPAEIAATLQLAREISDHVVLVYQPHQNVRQYEIKGQYGNCMELADEIYWLPTYLSREDPNLAVLTPEELIQNLTNASSARAVDMNGTLWDKVCRHIDNGHLVLVMGAGDIDTWLRKQLNVRHAAGILITDMDDNFVMQQRDDRPGIINPGLITVFGGAAEDNESSRDAALRELHEETSLRIARNDLTYLATLFQDETVDGLARWTTYFTLGNISVDNLAIYEGQGYVVIAPGEKDRYPLSTSAKRIITVYLERASTK